MSDADALARQDAQDREYIAACKAHGITPDAPSYRGGGMADDLIERHVTEQDGASKNGKGYAVHRSDPEPLKELSPEAEGAARLLDLLIPPAKGDAARFVVTAGRRMIVLAWMLGRRRESLAEIGRSLGLSRASLSAMCRKLEDRLHVHGRGQKRAAMPAIYAESARRSWRLRRLNKAFADAMAE